MSEINITLFHPVTQRTDAISIVPSSTTLADLSNFAMALLGLDDGDGDGGGVVLAKGQSRRPIYNPATTSNANANNEGNKTLAQCGVVDGEFISVYRVREFERMIAAAAASNSGSGSPARQRQRTVAPSAAGGVGGGGLDFSALLGGSSAATSSSSNNASSGGGGMMDFTALLTSSAATAINNTAASSTSSGGGEPVQWDGMNLDDAISRNPNPQHLMTILSNTTRHPNLLKELNYHNPTIVKKLQSANGNITKMAEIWRQNTMKSATSGFLRRHLAQTKETEMTNRLHVNPMDEEANAYFGNKIRLENVQRQYEQMMEEYPESLGRVLMLYMNCEVNGKPLQMFVDSGAQMTIMSSACADRLGLLHLVDDRFEGVAVGVGTGKILGKIHIVELTIGGYNFPCSITVMDSESGLGDKNMDCLFGLDMLKRHRCNIDLGKNVLRFAIGNTGETMEAPFLHEKDLPTNKGGTMGFDAEKTNAEIEARLEKMETEEEEGKEAAGDGNEKKNGSDDSEAK